MINVPFQKVKQREEEKKTTPFLMIQKSWVLVLRDQEPMGSCVDSSFLISEERKKRCY